MIVDFDVFARMQPLLAHGREALAAHFRNCADGALPIGLFSIHAVTEADFAAHPLLVLKHAVKNQPTHVICADGEICGLIARHVRRTVP